METPLDYATEKTEHFTAVTANYATRNISTTEHFKEHFKAVTTNCHESSLIIEKSCFLNQPQNKMGSYVLLFRCEPNIQIVGV